MTRQKWNEVCEKIFKKSRAYLYADWQPENINILILRLRDEADSLEQLTEVYEMENKVK